MTNESAIDTLCIWCFAQLLTGEVRIMQPIVYDDLVIRPYEHGSDDDKKGYILRNKMLSHSTGVDDRVLRSIFTIHDSEADQTKLGAFIGDSMVGTLSLAPMENGSVRIKQFAVTDKLQGRGIGKKLLAYAHATAKELGYKRIELSARQNVIGFYAKAGYVVMGELFGPPTNILQQMYIDL